MLDSIRRFYTAIFSIFGVLLFLMPRSANAGIRLIDIRGASNYINNGTSGTIDIYGGLAGGESDGTCASKSGSDTCNSCISTFTYNGTGTAGCNPVRIYDTLNLSISFVVDGNYQGSGYAMLAITPVSGTASYITSTGLYSAGQVATVTTLWSNLCSKMNTTLTGCSEAISNADVKIGLSINGTTINSEVLTTRVSVIKDIMAVGATDSLTSDCASATTGHGACDFEVFPGDEKAWVLDVKVPSTFPTGNNSVNFNKVRYFYSQDSNELVPNFGTYRDMYLNQPTPGRTSTGFRDSYIDGLTNGKVYYFMAASVDLAQNIGYFIQPTDNTKHSVRPDAVNGLLSNDGINCFIATAAYGSAWDGKVRTFRKFRNQYLLSNALGKDFVRFYYRHSPKLASFIEKSDTLRAGTRTLLFPFWAFAEISLRYGTLWAVSATLALFVFLILFIRLIGQRFSLPVRRR